jgi:DNA-binding transcriptional LysR family regulator
MNLNGIDLNLLLVFDALMIERSVTKAGDRVCLSQPAVSSALNRLRHLLNDDLFIRKSDGMHPTPRALELEKPIRSALSIINNSLEPTHFNPFKSNKLFTIAMNDLGAALFLPHLASRLSQIAPLINIIITHADGSNAIKLLEDGKVDMAIGLFSEDIDRFGHEKMYDIPCSCTMRLSHPLLKQKISIDDFAKNAQLAITHDGGVSKTINEILHKNNLQRRIAFTVPHFLPGIFTLANTDLIAVLPNKLISRFGPTARIGSVKTPFLDINISCQLIWNLKHTNSESHTWMRSTIKTISEDYRLDLWDF